MDVLKAAYYGDADALRSLLANGANPRARDAMGKTPLHLASRGGHERVIHMLIEAGSEPNASDSIYGRTPLHWASGSGFGGCIRALLFHGADPFVHDVNGHSAIRCATLDVVHRMTEIALWISKMDKSLVQLILQHDLVEFPRREAIVRVRRIRDLFRPMVDPFMKRRRKVLYRDTLFERLPWHVRVIILRFVTWEPIQKSWGRLEFEI